VTGCIWVTSLDRFDHQFEQLPIHALDLKIHLVHVPYEEERQHEDGETNDLESDEQESQDECK